MTDESNDIAVLKQLVLVGRYQMSDSGVKTSFLHIQDMSTGKAELNFLQTNSLNISKLCAFDNDGAAVMTGRRNRVSVWLKSHSPRMIAVHYINHRLALAGANTSDSIPYLKQFKSILQSLFYVYQNSAVCAASSKPFKKC